MAAYLVASMRSPPLALFALAALLALPAASAQAAEPAPELTTAFALEEIPSTGVTKLDFTYTLDCATILTTAGGDVALTLDDAPAWLNVTGSQAEIPVEDCLANPTGSATVPLSASVEPVANAPGLQSVALNATATYEPAFGDSVSVRAALTAFHVAYQPGHRLTPDGDQTFQAQGSQQLKVPLKIEILANARTMIMFEDKTVSNPDALVNGLKAQIYDVPPEKIGKIVEERTVVFTPPSGAWDKVTVSFRTYSHCLDGKACGNQLEKVVTWTFVNASPGDIAGQSSSPGSKGAPAPGLLLVAGAVGVALLMRRRIA